MAGLSARTVRRRLSSVSGLFAFLHARGDVAANPVPQGLPSRRERQRPRQGVPLVRTPRTLPRILEPGQVDVLLGAQPTATERTAGPSDAVPDGREKRQVRLTAQRILTRHLHPTTTAPDGTQKPDRLYGPNTDLDLTEAVLIDWMLTGCTVRYAIFDNATFTGDAGFAGATFTGGAWFAGSTFTGTAGFMGVTFNGEAGFIGVTFTDDAGFRGATFTGVAWFAGATFTDVARFPGATFTRDAWFPGATFTREAWFQGATFIGVARFDGATFTGNARFGRATFHHEPELAASQVMTRTGRLDVWPSGWHLDEATGRLAKAGDAGDGLNREAPAQSNA
jgi:hypothetical protein